MDLCAGMFSKATLVKYLHICWPLAVDITHNRERKAPNALIHWTAALLLLQWRKMAHCSASAQQAMPYLSPSFSFHLLHFNCFFFFSPVIQSFSSLTISFSSHTFNFMSQVFSLVVEVVFFSGAIFHSL